MSNCQKVEVFTNVINAGASGGPGGGIDTSDFLRTSLKLSEFSTQQQKAEVRQALELDPIDGGTFN